MGDSLEEETVQGRKNRGLLGYGSLVGQPLKAVVGLPGSSVEQLSPLSR